LEIDTPLSAQGECEGAEQQKPLPVGQVHSGGQDLPPSQMELSVSLSFFQEATDIFSCQFFSGRATGRRLFTCSFSLGLYLALSLSTRKTDIGDLQQVPANATTKLRPEHPVLKLPAL
jgi:hypothetical protein